MADDVGIEWQEWTNIKDLDGKLAKINKGKDKNDPTRVTKMEYLAQYDPQAYFKIRQFYEMRADTPGFSRPPGVSKDKAPPTISASVMEEMINDPALAMRSKKEQEEYAQKAIDAKARANKTLSSSEKAVGKPLASYLRAPIVYRDRETGEEKVATTPEQVKELADTRGVSVSQVMQQEDPEAYNQFARDLYTAQLQGKQLTTPAGERSTGVQIQTSTGGVQSPQQRERELGLRGPGSSRASTDMTDYNTQFPWYLVDTSKQEGLQPSSWFNQGNTQMFNTQGDTSWFNQDNTGMFDSQKSPSWFNLQDDTGTFNLQDDTWFKLPSTSDKETDMNPLDWLKNASAEKLQALRDLTSGTKDSAAVQSIVGLSGTELSNVVQAFQQGQVGAGATWGANPWGGFAGQDLEEIEYPMGGAPTSQQAALAASGAEVGMLGSSLTGRDRYPVSAESLQRQKEITNASTVGGMTGLWQIGQKPGELYQRHMAQNLPLAESMLNPDALFAGYQPSYGSFLLGRGRGNQASDADVYFGGAGRGGVPVAQDVAFGRYLDNPMYGQEPLQGLRGSYRGLASALGTGDLQSPFFTQAGLSPMGEDFRQQILPASVAALGAGGGYQTTSNLARMYDALAAKYDPYESAARFSGLVGGAISPEALGAFRSFA